MQSVYELATVEPHEPAGRTIPPADWEAYCAGYVRALQMALKVMELADVRWRLYCRERRRRRAQELEAAAPSVVLGEQQVAEHLAVTLDRPVDGIEQRAELAGRDAELERPVSDRVSQSEFVYVGPRFTMHFPATNGMNDRLGHSGTYRLEAREKELPVEGSKIIQQVGPPSVTTMSYPCSDARQSTAAQESRSPGQSKTTKRSSRRRRG